MSNPAFAAKPTLYKVMARVEEEVAHPNGEPKYRWVLVRDGMPRGTSEAIASQVQRDGFRLDMDRGALFYPAHRIMLVEAIHSDIEVK